jgi:hypothetical protein
VPRRDIAKSLDFAEAASVFASKSLHIEDDIAVWALVPRMLRWEMRPSMIIEATGLPRAVVNRLATRDGAKLINGRSPVCFANAVSSPIVHVAASLFAVYLRALSPQGSRVVTGATFARAYEQYLQAVAPGKPMLHASLAWAVVAKLWGEYQLGLQTCEVCATTFLQSAESISVKGVFTTGDCPLCRMLASKDRFTPLVIGKVRRSRARAAMGSAAVTETEA